MSSPKIGPSDDKKYDLSQNTPPVHPPKKRTREEILGSHIGKPLPPLPSQKSVSSPPPLTNVSPRDPPPPAAEVKKVVEDILVPEKKHKKKRFFKKISSFLTSSKNKRKAPAEQPSTKPIQQRETKKVTKGKYTFFPFLQKKKAEHKEDKDFLKTLDTIENKLNQAPQNDDLLRELINLGSQPLGIKILSAHPDIRSRYEKILISQLDTSISNRMDFLQELTVPQFVAFLKFAAFRRDECIRFLDIRQDLKHADFGRTQKYLAMLKELNEMKELTEDLSSVINMLKEQLVKGLKEDNSTLLNLQLSAKEIVPIIKKHEKFNHAIAEILSSETAFLDRMKYLTTPLVTITAEKTKKEKQVTFAEAFKQAGIINSNEAQLLSNTFEEIVKSSEKLVEKLKETRTPAPTDQEKLTKMFEIFGSNEFKDHLSVLGTGALKQKEIKAIFLKITQSEEGKRIIADFDPELVKKMNGFPNNPFTGVIADPFQRLGRYGILLKAVEINGAAETEPTLAQEGLVFLTKLIEGWTKEIQDKLS